MEADEQKKELLARLARDIGEIIQRVLDGERLSDIAAELGIVEEKHADENGKPVTTIRNTATGEHIVTYRVDHREDGSLRVHYVPPRKAQ